MGRYFSFNESLLRIIFITLLLISIFLNVVYIIPLGYFSDDFYLIENAGNGKNLWDFHYAPILTYFWGASAEGLFGTFGWHAVTLVFHIINTFFVYFLARKAIKEKGSEIYALFAALLFSASPAGCEAIIWICASGYVFTTFFVLAALCLLTHYLQIKKPMWRTTWLYSILFVILQGVGFLMWDWAITLFPILFIFTLIFSEALPKRVFLYLLSPVAICWFIGFVLRYFSSYKQVWQHNELSDYFMFYLGSPLLGVLPNISKTFFFSIYGVTALVVLWAFFFWTARRSSFSLACLLSYMVTITPWVLGGNPSSRYFYLSMAFLYLSLAIGISQISILRFRQVTALVTALTVLVFSYEKLQLWEEAYIKAVHLSENISAIRNEVSEEKMLVIVNPPSIYGPRNMPLLPQFWHGGIEKVVSGIDVVKTVNCPYSWYENDSYLNKRDEVLSLYPAAVIYEVVMDDDVFSKDYKLVPFLP